LFYIGGSFCFLLVLPFALNFLLNYSQALTPMISIGRYVDFCLKFILAFGIETHCWRPIDTLFRTITARRNPNLLLLSVGTLGGRPDLGMVMVAIWTVVCMGFHIERILQALFEKSRGIRIEAWDETSQSEPKRQPVESQRNLEGVD